AGVHDDVPRPGAARFEEDKISRLELLRRHGPAGVELVSGDSWKVDADLAVGPLDEAGAVKAALLARLTAPDVGLADLSEGVVEGRRASGCLLGDAERRHADVEVRAGRSSSLSNLADRVAGLEFGP